jgi:16S rRNA (guanine527-N7)-methyltransferase
VSHVVAYLERMTGSALGRPATAEETAKLHKYLQILIKWQKAQRLLGSAEPAWIVDNVIVDSLLFARALPSGIRTICDVGSGAGIPGIPLSVVLPAVSITLLEARQKRASFLAAAIRDIPLPNCQLLNRRLDEVAEGLQEHFDAAVMRCAGDPTALVRQVSPLLQPGGLVVASGPPKRQKISLGSWLEMEGPHGERRFWVHHVT